MIVQVVYGEVLLGMILCLSCLSAVPRSVLILFTDGLTDLAVIAQRSIVTECEMLRNTALGPLIIGQMVSKSTERPPLTRGECVADMTESSGKSLLVGAESDEPYIERRVGYRLRAPRPDIELSMA